MESSPARPQPRTSLRVGILSRTVWSVLDAPVGDLLLTAQDGSLTGIWFSPHKESHRRWDEVRATGTEDDTEPVLAATRRQLREYFDGERTAFDLPMAPTGTPFQLRVWTALRNIPYGQTASYGELAGRLALIPGAARAVGLANGANPISIVVPCHRVVGANGSLTGYAGGLDRKRFLLDLERVSLF